MIFNNLPYRQDEDAEWHRYFSVDLLNLMNYPYACVVYQTEEEKEQAEDFVYSLIRPSVVKDNKVNYYLNRNDLTKKANGTPSNLDGTDGDVCVTVPAIYWQVTKNEKYLEIHLSNRYFDGSYNSHTFNGKVRKYKHLGMFQMPEVAHSICGGTETNACSVYDIESVAWGNIIPDTIRTAVNARNDNAVMYQYNSLTLYTLLLMYAKGGVDSQTLCGMDMVENMAKRPLADTGILTCGGKRGSSSMYDPVTYLYMNNPWGGVFVILGGLKQTQYKLYQSMDGYSSKNVEYSDNEIPEGWEEIGQNMNIRGCVTDVKGSGCAPFLPTADGGTTDTYYCDYAKWQKSSGALWACCGGGIADYKNAGLWRVMCDYGWGNHYSTVGGRIEIYDEEIVV